MEATSRIEVVRSRSNGILIAAAESFSASHPETLFLCQPGAGIPPPSGSLGTHRLSFLQFARQAALPKMAERGLVPISAVGAEALAAHVVFQARAKGGVLKYFHPVAWLPGFSKALARTL